MANLLTSTRSAKKRLLLCALESTVGTDANPTAANWIEARNLNLTPLDIETADRNIDRPYYGNGGKLIVGQYVKLAFDVALVGSGTAGTAPKMASILRACGMSENVKTDPASVLYNVVSDSMASVTSYVNIDGALHKMIGSRGTFSLSLPAKGIPLIKAEMQSVYEGPISAPPPAVSMAGWPIEEPVTATTTAALKLGDKSFAFSSLEFALNNQMARINLPGPQREIAITDRQPTANVTILAPSLSEWDPFKLAADSTLMTMNVIHGSAAGRKVQLDGKVRLIGVEHDTLDGALAYKLTLEPTPENGNDEFVLTFL